MGADEERESNTCLGLSPHLPFQEFCFSAICEYLRHLRRKVARKMDAAAALVPSFTAKSNHCEQMRVTANRWTIIGYPSGT
jgi:hypothetical protein